MAVTFVPPDDNTAPTQGHGGASRGSARFIPPPDNATPLSASGGASRIGFTPPSDNAAPHQSASGASRVGFIPPPDNATPLDSASGGSRSESFEDISPLLFEAGDVDVGLLEPAAAMVAVTPPNFYGLTVSARPTIMAYLPKTKAHTAIFSLKDENQSVIYRQAIPLNEAHGILSITVPEEAPELVVGKYYHWFVTLQTEEYITPGSPYVDAWIKRVDWASVMTQVDLPTQDGLAKAEIFAQAGIWYDAAEQLANLQTAPQTQHDSSLASWTEFLTSVGLNELVGRSLL